MDTFQTIPAQPAPNRVLEDLRANMAQELAFQLTNPLAAQLDHQRPQRELRFLQSLANGYRSTTDEAEKITLRYIRSLMQAGQTRLQPSTFGQLLQHPLIRWIREFISGDNIAFERLRANGKVYQASILHDFNLEALALSVKERGFYSAMDGPLNKHLQLGADRFDILYTDQREAKADFILHFEKTPGLPIYQLTAFSATARVPIQQLNQALPRQRLQHTFSVNDHPALTATYAAALVNGAAVCPDEAQSQWLYIDQQGQLQTCQFSMARQLQQLPLATRDLSQQQWQALYKGASTKVELTVSGQRRTIIVQAAPREGKLLLFSLEGQPLTVKQPVEVERAAKILAGTEQTLSHQLRPV